MKSMMVSIGNLFFHYRNKAFPVIICALFLIAAPPSQLFESTMLEHVKDVVALLIALSGLAVRGAVIGYAYIKRGGLNKKVYAENLVTQGMFSLCRNPLYVGNVLIYAGVFLMHGNPVVTVSGILTFLFIYQCIILAEEAYLEDKFGAGYRAYCAEVPRWLPNLSRFGEATEGMAFNMRRVILKDYTTMATTIIILAVTEGYEFLALPTPAEFTPYLMLLSSIILLAAIFALAVQVMKKRRWLTETPSA